MYKKPFIIAEIGCNHKGDFETAMHFIEMASIFCKVDAVKFQKRNPKECLTKHQYDAPHPNPINSYGSTYGEHREYLEFDLDQHKKLKEYCEKNGLVYSTSVWDLTSAKEITSLNPKFIKIPSACNNHYEMLDWLCMNYNGEIHISLGMTTHIEEEKLFGFFEERSRNKDLVLYACTSGYPVAEEDICLLEINRIKELYGNKVKDIGFSGHHIGVAVDMAAYTLGASVMERHFTLDRTWKGTDHSASLEPYDMRRLAEGLTSTYKALTHKKEEILDVEKIQRDKLKFKG